MLVLADGDYKPCGKVHDLVPAKATSAESVEQAQLRKEFVRMSWLANPVAYARFLLAGPELQHEMSLEVRVHLCCTRLLCTSLAAHSNC